MKAAPGWILKPLNVFVTTVLIILVVLMILMILLGVTVLDLIGQYLPKPSIWSSSKAHLAQRPLVLILFMAIA